MGEAAIALAPFPKGRKPREAWAKRFTDAEIRRALERQELTAREHMLLERLCGLSLQEGYAWINRDDLAALVRCSVRTLYETTRSLCERGLLETTLTLKGLRYFPQWEAIGLERSGQESASSADPDRQVLPMLRRSTTRSKNKSSSRHEPSSPNPEAALLEEEWACPAPAGAALQVGHAPVEAIEVDLPLQSLTAAEMAEADRELASFRALRSCPTALVSSEPAPVATLPVQPKPVTKPSRPLAPLAVEDAFCSEDREASSQASTPASTHRMGLQQADSAQPRAKTLSRPSLQPALPDIAPALLSALCALPGGMGALRLLTQSRLPAESATRVVERVLAYDRKKGVQHAARFIRSPIADAVEDLCARAERSQSRQHDYQPEAIVRREAAAADPELAALKLRRRDIRGMLVTERSSLMRDKLERELRELEAAITGRTPTQRSASSS